MTKIRELGRSRVDGYFPLADTDVQYADGSEQRVLTAVEAVVDRSSDSVELEQCITDWPTRYHLDSGRADALRLLDLDPTARVLEIGCGCGAITRYLGERVAVVDAIEPMPNRARVAAARTRDLPNVAVFLGTIDDVPVASEYDLIIVWGVLEYVAQGSGESAPYVEFLSRAHALLAPTGQLVCAIENAVGVKYLCGSPEDHTARPFDSVEGYPRSTPARTFGRERLVSMLSAAGFATSTVLAAFPDYKFTRFLASDALFADPEIRSIAWEAPRFPSPDRAADRWVAADERALWRMLVSEGLGNQFGNSFLVIADASARLERSAWPASRRAAFASTARRPEFRVLAWIEQAAQGLCVRREHAVVGAKNTRAGIEHRLVDIEPVLIGPTLSELMVAASLPELERLLTEWNTTLDAAWDEDPGLLDLAAHNIKLVAGQLVPFDQEWSDASWPDDARRGRVAFLLALTFMEQVDSETWPAAIGLETLGDLTTWIAARIGLVGDAWIESFVTHESKFGVAVRGRDLDEAAVEEAVTLLRERLELPLEAGAASNRRAADRARAQVMTAYELQTVHVNNLQSTLDHVNDELRTAHDELAGIHASRIWRVLERGRVLCRKLRRTRHEAT